MGDLELTRLRKSPFELLCDASRIYTGLEAMNVCEKEYLASKRIDCVTRVVPY